jgi:hypothetical protein
MGVQIIKQPNGKYCIFSSIIDSITHCNMDEQDIINELAEKEKMVIEKQVKEIIIKLNKGEKPYFQFTKNYDEMIETIEKIHGIKEVKKIKRNIDKLI